MERLSKFERLNPFEVREVLQELYGLTAVDKLVSIPLKSGRCCKYSCLCSGSCGSSQSLWSQGGAARWLTFDSLPSRLVSIPLKSGRCCKQTSTYFAKYPIVSIPLKSGRCCKSKKMWIRWLVKVSIPLKSGRCCKINRKYFNWFGKVSIPLKSGRCCKMMFSYGRQDAKSQSLWSQGGAASWISAL